MTHRRRTLYGMIFSLALCVAGLGINLFMSAIVRVPMLPYALFDWLAVALPGDVVTWGLDRTIDAVRWLNLGATDEVGKAAERMMAIALFLALAAGLGALFGRIRQTAAPPIALAFGLIPLIPTILLMRWLPSDVGTPAVNQLWFGIMWVCWALMMQYFMWHTESLPDELRVSDADSALTRRKFLRNSATLLGLIGLGGGAATWFLGNVLLDNDRAGKTLSLAGVRRLFPQRPTPTLDPQPGTRDEISPISRFYVIDKNLLPPNVDADGWQLTINGAVNNELSFTYDEILTMPTVEFYATLECISNEIGGDLIDTTLWTGVPLYEILMMAGVQQDAVSIKFESSDGYYETLPLADAMGDQTVLCFGMGGQSLTVRHGFPVRLYTPGRYGMKNPKWIHTITAITRDEDGYWTDRNWDKEAFIKTESIIDIGLHEDNLLKLGGIAFSGDKGIAKVEVRIDTDEWHTAELRGPLSPLSWALWRADLPVQSDGRDHDITVRAIDGDGAEQIARRQGARPDGASGYHRIDVRF